MHFNILIFYANTIAGLVTDGGPTWAEMRMTPTAWF
jgi:hypothetical protein